LELQGEGGAAMCVGRRCCEHWSPLLCGAVTGAARKAVAVRSCYVRWFPMLGRLLVLLALATMLHAVVAGAPN
jgi:hypothetical protein